MKKFKMLILTDHSNHSSENSLYDLAVTMHQHPRCGQVDVATRANPHNALFFNNHASKSLEVSTVNTDFKYTEDGAVFKKHRRQEFIRSYEVVWLRMPPPLSEKFLAFLHKKFPEQLFINDPQGIWKTGSKNFLLNFQEICPPMQSCTSVSDIIAFKKQFPIVLKPFRDYGGRGIVRIDGDEVWEGKVKTDFSTFIKKIESKEIEYLGVKFLKNVGMGDKRIVIVDGQIMGASLRLPARGSWICNVAMGGSSNATKVDPEEVNIVKTINPALSEMGIVMYGVDTLVNDQGKRTLSEINTTSIGGLPQIAKLANKPKLKEAIELISNFIITKTSDKDAIIG